MAGVEARIANELMRNCYSMRTTQNPLQTYHSNNASYSFQEDYSAKVFETPLEQEMPKQRYISKNRPERANSNGYVSPFENGDAAVEKILYSSLLL